MMIAMTDISKSHSTPGGVVLTADTVLIDVGAGSNGCPESTTINFVLQGNSNTGSQSITACDSYTQTPINAVTADSTWTTSGTYTYIDENKDYLNQFREHKLYVRKYSQLGICIV